MKCENHPNVPAVALCGNCSTPVCGVCATFGDSSTLCERCADFASVAGAVASRQKESADFNSIMSTDTSAANRNATIERATSRDEKIARWDRIHMGIVVLSCVFIGIRIYGSLNSSSSLSMVEVQQEELYRDQLDSCVYNFWQIAELLQNDELPGDSLNCSESGLPNVITRVGDDIIVRHPSPQLLGYTDIFVSKNDPVPKLVL